MWPESSYLPRRTLMSILHLEKLEAWRSRATGMCVLTLTLMARDAGDAAWTTVVDRAPEVRASIAEEVAAEDVMVEAGRLAAEAS